MLQIDASQVEQFAEAAAQVPQRMGTEVAAELNKGATQGVTSARGFVNSQSGRLAAGIQQREHASPGGLVASYSVIKSSALPYPFQREYGGTILPKRFHFLRFQINGRWVLAREVHQRGSRYMRKSFDAIRPKVIQGVQSAVRRSLRW